MKLTPESLNVLVKKIAECEDKLLRIEWEIEEIGQPAAQELQRRLDALKIEEHALQRNLAEALELGDDGSARMEKVEALLAHIEREEADVEHEADFLHQSAPTTAEFAAQAGNVVVRLCARALKRVIGNHHPLGMSVFVNHSHETLTSLYGLTDEEVGSVKSGSKPS